MGTFHAVCILPYSFQIRENTEEKALYPNNIYALKMTVTDPFGYVNKHLSISSPTHLFTIKESE